MFIKFNLRNKKKKKKNNNINIYINIQYRLIFLKKKYRHIYF